MTQPLRSEAFASSNITERLADFVTGAEPSGNVLARAVPLILDTLAVTLAGGVEPPVQRLRAALPDHAGQDSVRCFWSGRSLRADDAAMLFGMASHVLDYDDVAMLAACHPSAPIVSALLACADRERVSAKAFLTAFAVGTEVMVRMGEALGFRHYALGFHATGTLGTLGAAAACARLLDLDRDETRSAIAIAASMAAGLRKNFGTMVKSLHVGLSAANGLRAAQLARGGIEGALEVFEEQGFMHAFSGGERDAWSDKVALGEPFAFLEPGYEQKRYPCCYLLHKIIEATLSLRREHGLSLGGMRRARVVMPRGGTKPLIHPTPRTGLNALFSAPYALCAALEDGRIDLASFTDEAVLRPAVQARLKDVVVVEEGPDFAQGADIGSAPVTVTVTTAAGAEFARTIELSPGSPRDPITPSQAQAKWRDCLSRAQPALDAATDSALFEEGARLTEMAQIGPWLERIATSIGGRR